MDQALREHIEYLLCIKIGMMSPISGGDISQAYLLETDSERFFCKVNQNESAYTMFKAERAGLEAISMTNTIAAPRVILCEPLEKGGLLLMEYIEPKRASPKEMVRFAQQLAGLHSHRGDDNFGWETDNFIGNLPQSNNQYTDWSKFYVAERLAPQLKLAKDSHRLRAEEIPSEERLLKTCENLFPKIKPALLHGDLWSGNYLIATDGTPYIFDPATYIGHREVDMAMTQLFGGFGTAFYKAYSEHFPKVGRESERTEIYQLYYLLVHLNLFGRSYYASVKSILKRYF